jgi:prepilin-type processing-associated H-X9-DG protein
VPERSNNRNFGYGYNFSDDADCAPEHRSGPDARHDDRASALFADGHIERLSAKALSYAVNSDDSIAVNGKAAHNRRFSGVGEDLDPPSIH